MSVDRSGKGYAPLPQSISNTDTEDEEEHLTRPDIAQKENNETTMTEPASLHKNGTYYPLDETRNVANRMRNGQSTLRYYRDDVPIMVIEGDGRDDLWKRRDMSPLRRFCLVTSVLLCLSTILVFLYVLPCNDTMVCPSVIEPQSSISWDKTLQGIELHGPISLVLGSPHDLIFLLRGQKFGENGTKNHRESAGEGNGIMSMQGNTGLPLWRWLSKRVPTDIDCISLDTDKSGKPDCIVVGDQGLLASIEPTEGTAHWSSTAHTFPKLPVILPDIDSDNIEDLLSVELATERTSSIVFISGATGRLLGRYPMPPNCSVVDIYELVSGSVSINCQDADGKRTLKSITFKKLLNDAVPVKGRKKLNTKRVTQPRIFESLKGEEEFFWKPTPYHRLSIENEGTCPGESCRVSVNLTLQTSTNETLPIWDYVRTNSIASKPAFLITEEKPYTTGFVIKVWHWLDSVPEKFESDNVIRKLAEIVYTVFVNDTDVQVTNASQNDVVQLCRGSDCQPNLNLRTRFSSVAISYFGTDGPKLISYRSSYDLETSKVLTSKVQVVKLDSLVSFYPRTST